MGVIGWLQMGSMLPVHVIMFLPAIVLGIIGGVLAATFTLLNIRIVKQRSYLISLVHRSATKKFLRMLEPVVIMVRVCIRCNAVSTVVAVVKI